GGILDAAVSLVRGPSSDVGSSWAGARRPAVLLVLAAAAAVAFWPFHLDDGRFAERLRLAKVLMNEHDYDGTVRQLEQAHAIDPSDTATEFNLGMALVSDGRAQEGIGLARHAVDAGTPVDGARYALANVMLMSGDREGAGRLVATFFPAASDTADSCYHVAILALNAGNP